MYGRLRPTTTLAASADTMHVAGARGSSSESQQLLFRLQQITIGMDAATIIYYLVTTELITTVAHACAVVMGIYDLY
jgi:chemotaxis signal transduction protein